MTWYYGGIGILAYSTDAGINIVNLGGDRTNDFAFTHQTLGRRRNQKKKSIIEHCRELCANSGSLKSQCEISCVKKVK
jgi:hypothetical protein